MYSGINDVDNLSSKASDEFLSPAYTGDNRNPYAGFWFCFVFQHREKVNNEAIKVQCNSTWI